jgi:hypothetical protein
MEKSTFVFWGLIIFLAVLVIAENLGVPVFQFLGTIILALMLGAIGFVFRRSKLIMGIMIAGVIILIVGSAGVMLAEEWKFPWQFNVNVDNTVKVVPPPDENDPGQVRDWLNEKVGVERSEGIFGTAALGLSSAAAAWWLATGITYLLSKVPFDPINRIKVPVQLVFLLVWVGLSMYYFASPLGVYDFDPNTSGALNRQWWLGFTKNIWWAIVATAVSWGFKSFSQASGMFPGSHAFAMGIASLVWAGAAIFTATIDPTGVAWQLCAEDMMTSAITNKLCMETFTAGKLAALAISIAWAWLMSFLELGGD